MKDLLLKIKEDLSKNKLISTSLEFNKQIDYETRYNQLIQIGKEEDYNKNHKKYSISKKKSKSLNLLNRLYEYKKQVLASTMYDFEIPFDNNLADRDNRMTKVKQKVSVTLRSSLGADAFTRIRGFVQLSEN